jgi:hypothetical protein
MVSIAWAMRRISLRYSGPTCCRHCRDDGHNGVAPCAARQLREQLEHAHDGRVPELRGRTRLGVGVLLFALWPLATEMTALTSLIAMNVVLWLMIAYENAHYDERRYRLRHGLDPSG